MKVCLGFELRLKNSSIKYVSYLCTMYGISVLKNMVTLLTIFERNEPIQAEEEVSLAIHTMYFLENLLLNLIIVQQKFTILTKVVIQKSRREVSPVEQYTIDCEYLAYFQPKRNSKKKFNFYFFYKRDIMQLFSADATMFLLM